MSRHISGRPVRNRPKKSLLSRPASPCPTLTFLMPKAAPYCFCSSPGLLASHNAISHRACPGSAAGEHDEAHEFSKHGRAGSHRRKKTAWAELFRAMPPPLSLSDALNPRRRTWHLHGKTSLQAGYSGAAGLFRRQSSFGPMRGLRKPHSRNGPRR
jgi:hypothetical protein